jgi:hypothetical protein
MIEGTQPSQELMEKNLLLTQEDWMNILADWSGSQKDIECGIRIRIHTDAGSVTLSSSSNSSELSLYLKLSVPKENLNNTKSEEL